MRFVWGAALLAAMAAAPAGAAIINLDFTLVASGFGSGAPVDPVTGRFTLSFDNSADIGPSSAGLGISGFNLGYGGVLYIYQQSTDTLSISTFPLPDGYVLTNGENSFGFVVQSASGAFNVPNFGYTSEAVSFSFNTNSVTVAPAVTGVPEPDSWALLIAGFGLTGAALRRRPRLNAA